MRRTTAWLTHVLVLACAACPAAGAAGDPPPARVVAERTLACTVGIRCTAEPFVQHRGTGIVVSPAGHILTATTVVPPGARSIRVTFPGFVVREATLVAVDEPLAVALLQVEAGTNLPHLRLARELPAVGSTAYTAADVENALLVSGRASFSRGLISGLYELPRQADSAATGIAVETTAAVNPGSDGGPLVDAAGNVCGVITLGTLPLRWQGTAVPTKVLRERFAPFAAGGILPADEPAGASGPDADPLAAVAAEIAAHLVGIEVERQFAPESLPQPTWQAFRSGIPGFAGLPEPQQAQRFADYLNVARAMEVNQLLRRPAAAVTGMVVSPDGFVLTSLFNVGGDVAFVRKNTGQPRSFDVHEPIRKLLAESEGGLEQRPNSVTRITVVLRDGSRHEARVVARHEPLGVALLKIEARDLPWYDLVGNSTSPQLGDAVGLVGHLPGNPSGFTLNAGIVSAPSRNRGYQFQTDALVNYGNTGGPLFDRAGNFLGLAAAPIQPDTILGRLVSPQQLAMWSRGPNSGVGLAARGDRIRDVLEAMQAGRSFDRIPGPFLGVMADETKAFGDTLVVAGVAPGSPAERAGIVRGDTVLEIDGRELRNWPDLTELIAACKPGQVVEVKVQRRGQGPRLVIAGRPVETVEDLQRLAKALRPGERFEGVLSTDDTRTIRVALGENR